MCLKCGHIPEFKLEIFDESNHFRYFTCGYCNRVHERILEKHDLTHFNAKAPCTEAGWEAYDVCSKCGYSTFAEIPALGHLFSEEWTADKEGHWHACTREGCKERQEQTAHTPDEYGTCNVCGYIVWQAGDPDGDGMVSDWDGVLLERYLAGWETEVELKALDIDGDGRISDWDAVLFDRYQAGWEVECLLTRGNGTQSKTALRTETKGTAEMSVKTRVGKGLITDGAQRRVAGVRNRRTRERFFTDKARERRGFVRN